MTTLLAAGSFPTSRYRLSGWILSFITHVTVACFYILFLNDVRLAEQPKPFTWNVSFVQPAKPDIPSRPAPDPTPAAKPVQRRMEEIPQQRMVRESPLPVERQVVETRPVTRTVQSAATPRAAKPTATPQREEPVLKTPVTSNNSVESQKPVVRELESVSHTAETHVLATRTPAATPSENAMVRESQVVHQQAAVVSESPPITQEPGTQSDTTTVEKKTVSQQALTAVHHQALPGAVTRETALVENEPVIESPRRGPEVVEVESTPMAVESLPVVERPEQAAVASLREPNMKTLPRQSIPAAKQDYGWLREALWHRIEKFKRYPHLARSNRWEGIVLLEAVINNSGQLIDLRVAESSGYAILDEEAMEVLRKSCPIHLPHPLGRTDVTVRVPISYKLR